MSGFHLCESCDALRDTDSAYCPHCEAVTPSYIYHPSEREEFELLALASAPMGFQREANTGLISFGEDRRAAA